MMKTLSFTFSGAAAATWTLPPTAGNTGLFLFLANRGTANVTVQRAGTDSIYGTTTVTSMVMPPNSSRILHNDGTYWIALSPFDGIDPGEQFVTLTAPYTLTSQTGAQKLFNATTNGAVTLGPGTYFFECAFTLSALSATSGSFGWTLAAGTATISAITWQSLANKAALATAAAPQSTVNTAANTSITAATTNTVGWGRVWGKVMVSAGGTVIPQVSLTQAAAAVVGAHSSFRIWSVGANGATTAGAWS